MGPTVDDFKALFAGVLTLMVSLIFVPVFFIVFAVIEWNFFIPLLQSGLACDERWRGHSDYSKHYMYYLSLPFIACIKGFRYTYDNIRDALD